MKKISIYSLLFFSSLLISIQSFSQTIDRNNTKDPIGQYKSPNGLDFFINRDSTFYMLKRQSKAFDAAIPGCDTIAKGTWHFCSESLLKLSNDAAFQNVRFDILEENRLSEDSIYFKIDLPKDEAFYDGKFKFQITVMGKIDVVDSTSPMIILSKKKIFQKGDLYYHLSLTIQDLSPLNCKLNGRCYQRIYFNIFEDYKLNAKSNYFTIKLKDFNDCYVERADVDDQLVLLINNKVHWQDIEFLKVK